MKIYTEETTCCVCGGPGMCRPGHSWFETRHSDPSVCAAYLRRARAKLAKEVKLVAAERQLLCEQRAGLSEGSA